MVHNPEPHVMFVSDTVWHRYGADLLQANPTIEPVLLTSAEPLAEQTLDRITTAFFSGDVWPARTREMMISILKAKNLEWLHTFSAGVDSPVFQTMLERGVRITNSAGASSSSIAQTVVMYMLALSRDLPEWQRAQERHEWQQRSFQELSGATIAVIGLGAIGQEVVRLSQALDMNVIACRRTPHGDEPCPTYSLAELHVVLHDADWIVIALPLNADTRHIINAEVIAKMKPGACFINVGRGELVDEQALVSALQTGHLGGAGLDVFEVEPLPTQSALWDMPNVIITPHNSATTPQSHHRAALIFIDNVARHAKGLVLRNEVTL